MSSNNISDWKSRPDYTCRQTILSNLRAYTSKLLEGYFQESGLAIQVEFYPYVGLRNTVRAKENGLCFRISDMLTDAPLGTLKALMLILLHRLWNRRPPSEALSIYKSHISQQEIVRRTYKVRKHRGRKRLTSPRGAHFDLVSIFQKLNQGYFNNEVEIAHLSWSSRQTSRTLGHYDPAHETIVISKTLDRPNIPTYVVAFVVFHEMLHAFLGDSTFNGKRQPHGPRFRLAEKDFAEYQKAKDFIEKVLGFL
jgi:hypothetical protein